MKFHVAFLIFPLLASVAVPNQMVMQAAAFTSSDQKYQQALERYKSLLQAEINTVQTQLRVLGNQIHTGKIRPDGPEIISARRAHLQLLQRMAAFDAGVIQIPEAPSITLLPASEANLKARQAREDFGKFLEEEIELVKLQIKALDKKFQAGALDMNGPEMMSTKRELFELQQRMAVFDAGLLMPSAANQPSR